MTLREATEHDWEVVRALRLEALRTEPGFFGGRYAIAAEWDSEQWRAWCAGAGKMFFLLFDGEAPVGITAIFADRDDPTTAVCGVSYLTPAYRGRTLSRLFYQARLDWARAQGFRRVTVGHRLSNTASMRANQAFGFRETGRKPYTWPDGTEEPEVLYELWL